MNTISMSNFIFQSVPQQYNLKALAKSGDLPARVQSWKATRYRDIMDANDGVFFYMSGKQAGIYGCGHIVDPPTKTTKRVLVKWIALYHPPILRHDLEPILKENLLFTVKVGTNFRLSYEENSKLRRLVQSRGFKVPP
jgi:hypothetical protein